MESRDELLEALSKINRWEQEQKDLWFWEKIGRLPFVLLDKVTPVFIQEKIGQLIDELSSYVETGGQYLVKEQDVCKRFSIYTSFEGEVESIADIEKAPLAWMDRIADDIISSRSKLATVQGATTGVGGIFTLVLDIPLLIGMSLKVLQEMALCYGFDPKEKSERIFIVKCLQFSSADIVGKKAILEEIALLHTAPSRNQTISQLQGWREVVMTYRDQFGWKKLFQLIPIAGIVFGAYSNKKTVEDVAEVGKMLYQKRRIMQRLDNN